MSTVVAILGDVGLFLLGMTVMTDSLKALAGSALRTVLGKAAATPLSGAIWGAVVTAQRSLRWRAPRRNSMPDSEAITNSELLRPIPGSCRNQARPGVPPSPGSKC